MSYYEGEVVLTVGFHADNGHTADESIMDIAREFHARLNSELPRLTNGDIDADQVFEGAGEIVVSSLGQDAARA